MEEQAKQVDNEPAGSDAVAQSTPPSGEDAAPGTGELFSPALLGQWFGVPMLIVGAIVGGAVLVVFLFGAPATDRERSIDSLLQTLEANSGKKSAGVLLPKEKELWQTALELTQRLENKDAELTEEEVGSVAARLVGIIRADMEAPPPYAATPAAGQAQESIRSRRLEFAIHALGRTECPAAVGPLIDIVRDGREPYVRVALQELGNLYEVPEARSAVETVMALLDSSDVPETLLTACTVLSVLAKGDDQQVVEALERTRLSRDGEVAWSAALAMARLGSAAGKSTLTDLLDRSFWEKGERYERRDESGAVHRYKMPAHRVDGLLIAAIDATANLDDPDLWVLIEQLKSDPSAVVRGRAVEAVEARLQG